MKRRQSKLTFRIVLTCVLTALPALAHESGFPEKTLKTLFPEAAGFTTRKKTLTPAQVKKIEQESGSKVQRDDNPLTFYVAIDKASKPVGLVLMIDARGAKGPMDLALAANLDGSIHRLLITENDDEAALGSAAFLDQLKGKTAQTPLTVGKDIKYSGTAKSGQALLNAVRRGLLLLSVALGN